MLLWVRHGARLGRDLVGQTVRSGRAHVAAVVLLLLAMVGLLAVAGTAQPAVPWTVYTLF